MRIVSATVIALLTLSLAACGSNEGEITIPPQHWKDMDIRVETHPNPPLAGMSEVVVIVTGPRGRPSQDLTISLRGDDSIPWVQTIQDGLIGVYRRAVDLGDGEVSQLRVQVKQGDDKKTLLFPLKLSPS